MRLASVKILLRYLLVMLIVLGPGTHMLAMAEVFHHGVEICDSSTPDTTPDVPVGQEEMADCTGNCICTQMPAVFPLQEEIPPGNPTLTPQGILQIPAKGIRIPDPFPPELP